MARTVTVAGSLVRAPTKPSRAVSPIRKIHPAYAQKFRRQMVGVVRVGRDLADLARAVEPAAQAFGTG